MCELKDLLPEGIDKNFSESGPERKFVKAPKFLYQSLIEATLR